MSVVAHLLLARGAVVSGSDARGSAALDALAAAGADVHVGHDPAHVSDSATVVVSTAVRESNPELAHARARGQRVIHRSEALALVGEGLDFVAVAGAHGKTTTSALIATTLIEADLDPSYAIGGSVLGVGSGGHLGSGSVLVAEADESDGSFLNYSPSIAVVTNIEVDHIDHWGTPQAFHRAFEDFAARIVPGGLLVACADDPGAAALAGAAAARGIRVVTYGTGDGVVAGAGSGTDTPGDGHAATGASVAHARLTIGGPDAAGGRGTLTVDGEEAELRLGVGGDHNLLNAAAAVMVARELGVPVAAAAAGVGAFQRAGVRVVDDYAHHPTEVAATLRAARVSAGGGRVLVLFQPHLFSRTRAFAEQFAAALDLADAAVVTDVYAAREDPEPGVDSSLITARMDSGEWVPDRFDAARRIADLARDGDLVITMGAGDVTELPETILERLGAAS
jgi:UDP-N-acetylmuramate--alanine ligase